MVSNVHVHTVPTVFTRLQINAYDPTRTTTLRNIFSRQMDGRFNALSRIIRQAIVELDVFGLRVLTQQEELIPPASNAFNFPRTEDKIKAFIEWLQRQENKGLLETVTLPRIGVGIEEPWTNLYILDSYKRGVLRARHEMRKAGYDVPTVDVSGGIEAVMGTPFHVDRVGVLFTRVFAELKGVTTTMDTQISRILAQGLIDGDNPRLLARKLVSTINGSGMGELGITDSLGRFIPAQRRAQMIARTEIIRAHHQAMVQEYKNWAADGFIVIAEWSTAGDERVCSRCSALEGNEFTLREIEHMIPLHPLCRCIAIPKEVKKK